MSARSGLEQATADHRAAIEEVARTIKSLDPGAWAVPRQPGKWSPAEIAEHLVISYEPPLAELDGGPGYAVPVPWWKRVVLRWKVLPQILEHGQFPRGAPAPREARPKSGAASPEEAVRRLRENAGRFEEKLCQAHAARSVRLTHAYFGKLTAPQILKLLAVHARHHRAQFPSVVP